VTIAAVCCFLLQTAQEWPLRLPMTKAAVRALDTITAFGAQNLKHLGLGDIQSFAVAGQLTEVTTPSSGYPSPEP
jgi:PhoPQ-activated pathogenicity-related protein